MARSRSFGHVERLPTGRYRARYRAPNGRRPSRTFDRKADANAWLAATEADILRREWRVPDRATVTVGVLAEAHIGSRPKESTRTNYGQFWRVHLEPWWSEVLLAEITPADVRRWHEGRQRDGVGAAAVAASYRLLHAILQRGVTDEVIPRNPAQLVGASEARTRRRPVLHSRQDVIYASYFMPPRYAAMPFLAWSSTARQGEMLEWRRRDVGPRAAWVRIERRVYDGVVDATKSEAGERTVHLPPSAAAVLLEHLARHVPADRDALIFGTAAGTHLERSNLAKMWARAQRDAGLPRARWHDLRHASGTEAARKGATAKELMSRMGHSTMGAAMRYQHAADTRDAELAARLDE